MAEVCCGGTTGMPIGGHYPGCPNAVPVEGDRERQRETIWAAQHDVSCDDGAPHPWTAHMPWDEPDDERAAIEEADAIIGALAGVSLTGSGLDVERLARALWNLNPKLYSRHGKGTSEWSIRDAATLAREYAALSGESGEPNPYYDHADAPPWLREDGVGESGEPKEPNPHRVDSDGFCFACNCANARVNA